MKITERTTLDWLLAYNTAPVTAEELYQASWEGSLDHADSGFKERYEALAAAINRITAMYGFGHTPYSGDDATENEAGRGL